MYDIQGIPLRSALFSYLIRNNRIEHLPKSNIFATNQLICQKRCVNLRTTAPTTWEHGNKTTI